MSVNRSARSLGAGGEHNRDIFSIFFNIKVRCVFSSEMQNLQICFFFKGLENEFETAVVNEPSVFEPLKFYCTFYFFYLKIILQIYKTYF